MAAWISVTAQLGLSYPGSVDSTQLCAVGTVARFRNETLGEGEFIYLAGAANVDAGDVCEYEIDYNASVATSTVAPWVGNANTPVSLAVATAATVASTWGWYQIGGSAVVNSSGSISDGDDLFWQAAGVVSATLVAGKQMLNASAASANGVPATNKVIVTMDRPLAQGVGDTSVPVGNITGLGTGVAAALAVNVGSAGAPVLFNGALGTPSSGTLTSATGLPVSTGISGLGTGVATALAVNVGSAGAPVVFDGALGTPSSGVATNLTGTAAGLTAGVASAVAVGGITGLGTGVATALAINTGSAGAPALVGGVLGAASATSVDFGGGAFTATAANSVSPTSPNRTITISLGGTTYYLAAKTTND